MLPAPARLRRRADFAATVRRGRRGRSDLLLVHLLMRSTDEVASVVLPSCGFVVSKAVGGAVVRNRVLRRLRHQVAARLDTVPPGSQLVVRALPAAATASSAELGTALDRALRRAVESAERREPVGRR
ncbi:MAG: ribonuclease P protein component [Actinomycetes bacterium]